MFKKYLPLFTVFLFTAVIALLFHPKKTLGSASHVVISQIQVAGTTTNDEFIELFNPTGSPVDLTGWRLGKRTSTGTGAISNLVASMSGTSNRTVIS